MMKRMAKSPKNPAESQVKKHPKGPPTTTQAKATYDDGVLGEEFLSE